MVTWILFLHLLMPSTLPSVSATAGTVDADTGLRHRGVERLFAKFDREAKAIDRSGR